MLSATGSKWFEVRGSRNRRPRGYHTVFRTVVTLFQEQRAKFGGVLVFRAPSWNTKTEAWFWGGTTDIMALRADLASTL
jgi:hypothetical protein